MNLSDYARRLEGAAKTRYENKIKIVGNDPFHPVGWSWSDEVLPPLESTDLVNYLVLNTSYYTAKQFKAFKSLEAYNHFVSGWIASVRGCQVDMKYVTLSQVC